MLLTRKTYEDRLYKLSETSVMDMKMTHCIRINVICTYFVPLYIPLSKKLYHHKTKYPATLFFNVDSGNSQLI